MVTHTERLINLERDFGNCVEKSVLTTLSKDTKNIKDQFKKLEDKIVVLQRKKEESQRLGIQSTNFGKLIKLIQ